MTITRDQQIHKFLHDAGWADAKRVPMREDASARKYYRLQKQTQSAVLMDAAPPFEEVGEFARKAAIFSSYGLSIPKIYARDDAHGLLLIEDYGEISFANAIRSGENGGGLYRDAIAALTHMHSQADIQARKLPPLDDGRLIYLVSWIIEWYIPLIQPQTLSRTIREKFFELWTDTFKIMRAVPHHAIHLDYQFHNLMLLPGKASYGRCGILDFQDACYGPVSADLVMLLQDAREDVPDNIVKTGLDQYLHAFPKINRDDFMASYAAFAAHNAARILGLFARLKIRDGKGQYLCHIPRNLKYFEDNLRHPALAPIKQWFDTHVPAEKRLAIPDLKAA
ncbi:MAG: hypothetical protein EYC62_09565 [Alphaproteobacteria bacterium]|nr:MAG: hypothetical protein EYC62_09565 [Alphaproteobacteria bacterium]